MPVLEGLEGLTNYFFEQPVHENVVLEEIGQEEALTCSLDDYNALMALYNATNGASWTNNGGDNGTAWGDPYNAGTCGHCDWYGVTCNAADRVESIALSGTFAGNNLIGTIPSEIGNLTNLTK